MVLERGRAELAGRALVVAGRALGAAVRQVLGLVVGPVLEPLRRLALLELVELLPGLLDVLLLLLGGVLGAVLVSFPMAASYPGTAKRNGRVA